jgi:hypothetical protein
MDALTGCSCTLPDGHSTHHVSREDPMTELHWNTPIADAVIKEILAEPPDEVLDEDEDEYERVASWMALTGEGY